MSSSCTPILVGVSSLVLEILLLSKTAKFPFRPMDYSPWSSKNLIDWNRLKKFMQVGIDVKFMYTDFGGRGLSGFGDKISLWSIKVENLIDRNRLKKFMQVEVNVTCMYTSFGGRVLSGFRDTTTLKNGQISLSTHGL